MHSRPTKILLSIAAVTALALPAGASARHGADDAPGHVRHADHVRGKHHIKHSSRAGDDRRSSRAGDDRRGRGRGTDDGPNHT